MHSLGIAHRDVKPDNVYFSDDNILKLGNPLLACTSFEVKELHSTYQTGNFGTPAYTAPEIFKSSTKSKDGKKIELGAYDGIKADCWAFGCFVYELCTFHHPFKYPTVQDYMTNIPNKKLKVPSVKINPKISTATQEMLKTIYKGLLNQDPVKRLSLAMVQEAINTCLQTNKIVLPPKSAEYTQADFDPFFKHITEEEKIEEKVLKSVKARISMLGIIPM